MKVYRMKHIPTGLYFCPSREIQVKVKNARTPDQELKVYVKSNLSKKGKVYLSKPTFKYIGNVFYNHLVAQFSDERQPTSRFVESEWVIEEID